MTGDIEMKISKHSAKHYIWGEHQMFNKSNDEIEFMVISQPNSKGDRIAVE
ncbi:hypothetical protein [Candidatus Pristimantibacillus sp. PTI5]|uniref:hypothetical protein n=1 Tax=Candidatus Pristimantibacillus sp. PTI5 TaxID=3400422 RepID=UPI003B019F42